MERVDKTTLLRHELEFLLGHSQFGKTWALVALTLKGNLTRSEVRIPLGAASFFSLFSCQ